MLVSAKNRITFLDTAKGIGMICVILGHMENVFIDIIVFSFHMPLFFFLSGYFISQRKEWSNLIPAKAKHLIGPYLFTGIAITLLSIPQAIVTHEDAAVAAWHWFTATLYGSGLLQSYFFHIKPLGAVWFLLAMFWALLLYNWIMGQKHPWVWVILSFSIGYGVTQILYLPWSILSGMTAVLFLHIGHLSRQKDVFSYLHGKYIRIAFEIWLLARFLECGYPLNLVANYFYNIPLDIIGSMAGAFLVLYIAKRLEKNPYIGQYLTWFGKYSLIVLCFHLIELNLFPWTSMLKAVGFENFFIPTVCGKLLWATGAIFLVQRVAILRQIFGVKA